MLSITRTSRLGATLEPLAPEPTTTRILVASAPTSTTKTVTTTTALSTVQRAPTFMTASSPPPTPEQGQVPLPPTSPVSVGTNTNPRDVVVGPTSADANNNTADPAAPPPQLAWYRTTGAKIGLAAGAAAVIGGAIFAVTRGGKRRR